MIKRLRYYNDEAISSYFSVMISDDQFMDLWMTITFAIRFGAIYAQMID